MAEDIAFLSATPLLEFYRTKDLSPAEVIGETLRRLERYEGAINAFVLYDPEEAMTWHAPRRRAGGKASLKAFSTESPSP